ncbi:ABC transporter substrate-binding protein [Martelella sp. HB161492]|uniref:ABC transporter substrate-binding protein n=1 Tax=Martelella sp. HB161492 TaxID=2720726 RepID=UPI001AEEC8F3|nr:ABC transporter substrate-binding protein [Martelella sp. HB161492]
MFRTFILAAMGALLISGASAHADPFRIIVTETEAPLVPNSLIYLAQQEGFFERAGVDVTLVPVQQTPMAIAALQAGDGDMANISLSSLLDLHAQGASDFVAVHSSDKAIPFIIAGRDDVTLKNMAGKRFGIGRPNSLDATMSSAVLGTKGVSLEAMTLMPLGQPAVRGQALMAGRVDATTLSIGSYLALPDKSNLHILVDVKDYFDAAPVVTKVDVVRRPTLETRAGDLQHVLEALTLAARDFAENPDHWVTAMEKARPDIAPETLEALAKAYANSWTVNGGFQKDELLYAQTWYQKGEPTNTAYLVDPANWIDFAPMDAVLKAIGPSDLGDSISR